MRQPSGFQVPKLLWSLGMLGASQSTLMKRLCLEATSVVCSSTSCVKKEGISSTVLYICLLKIHFYIHSCMSIRISYNPYPDLYIYIISNHIVYVSYSSFHCQLYRSCASCHPCPWQSFYAVLGVWLLQSGVGMTFGKRSRKHLVDWALIWLNWTQWGAKSQTDIDEPQVFWVLGMILIPSCLAQEVVGSTCL